MISSRPIASLFRWPNPKVHCALRIHCIRLASTRSAPSLNFQEIDTKWRKIWSERPARGASADSSAKKKSYILSMFPYPSGSLHMGHLRVYTISDVLARYKQMTGFDVLHPMGWDAFGLPAENAAIERGIDPAVWTERNIATMKEQLIGMNGKFDWSREIRTCSPSFYKHTQKIFLMLHKRQLAYQAEAMVNYDPVDKTVLANEQVDSNGRSWRSGAVVEQLKLKQWFFRITAFKEALLEDLNSLTVQSRWPERVVLQQRHWLGRSTGARIEFTVQNGAKPANSSNAVQDRVEVFTTRPDTFFGITYLALSINHPLVQEAAVDSIELKSFLEQAKLLPLDSKVGYRLPNLTTVHPLLRLPGIQQDLINTATVLPIYVAPYVLSDYGTGAVMGVPGHDNRDLAFWRLQNPAHQVPIVIHPADGAQPYHLLPPAENVPEVFTERGRLTALCGPYAGLESGPAGELIINDLIKCGVSAELTENWRLRDWLVSRQRYWGTPIPIIHCGKCGAVPVPDDQLPVELPALEKPSQGKSGNPLQNIERWVNTECPTCGGPAKRDTDTMDTFVDSSWYFMRFPDSQNSDELVSSDLAQRRLPVDTYLGGVEHAILHLLYARFIYKFLASEGIIPRSAGDSPVPAEPFRQLVSQGMVHGRTFSDPVTGRFLRPEEVELSDTSEPVIKFTGLKAAITWEKMSKSKHNGVDPLHCIQRFGADATRAHILFAAPVSEVLDWDEEKIVGIQRWFHRITRLVDVARGSIGSGSLELAELIHRNGPFHNLEVVDMFHDDDIEPALLIHDTISSVTHTFEHNLYALNTTVSDLIKLTNALLAMAPVSLPDDEQKKISAATFKSGGFVYFSVLYQGLSALLRMLAPIAPAFAEECWEKLHTDTLDDGEMVPSIFESAWPQSMFDASLASKLARRRKTMVCAVQVNGKLRFSIEIPALSTIDVSGNGQYSSKEEFLAEKLLESEQGKYWLTEKNDWEKKKRMIVVQGGKLVNIVY